MDRGAWWAAVHGVSQAIILEWVVISFSRESSPPRDQTCISCIAGRFFTAEQSGKPITMNMCVQLILKEVLPRKIKTEARQGEEKAVI